MQVSTEGSGLSWAGMPDMVRTQRRGQGNRASGSQSGASSQAPESGEPPSPASSPASPVLNNAQAALHAAWGESVPSPSRIPGQDPESGGQGVGSAIRTTGLRTTDPDTAPPPQAATGPAPGRSQDPDAGGELSGDEQAVVEEFRTRDREVRTHEQAHVAAAGGHAQGGIRYAYQTGPDGRQYAVGGSVSLDVSPVSGDPEATAEKARTIRQAALAPAQPSAQDRAVAAQASAMETEARADMLKAPSDLSPSRTGSRPGTSADPHSPAGAPVPSQDVSRDPVAQTTASAAGPGPAALQAAVAREASDAGSFGPEEAARVPAGSGGQAGDGVSGGSWTDAVPVQAGLSVQTPARAVDPSSETEPGQAWDSEARRQSRAVRSYGRALGSQSGTGGSGTRGTRLARVA